MKLKIKFLSLVWFCNCVLVRYSSASYGVNSDYIRRGIDMKKQMRNVSSILGVLVVLTCAISLFVGCTQGNNGENTGGGSYAPFTGENDQSLWKLNDDERSEYSYFSKGKLYDVVFNDDESSVKSLNFMGKVKAGKVVFEEDGTKVEYNVKIDGDQLTVTKDYTFTKVTNLVLVNKVKKAAGDM